MSQPVNGPTVPAPAPEANQTQEWTDEEYIHALAHLEKLHKELHAVRLIPQQIFTSFNSSPTERSDPTKVYQKFRIASLEGSTKLGQFQKDYEESKSRVLFRRCMESLKQNNDLKGCETLNVWGWEGEWERLKKEAAGTEVEQSSEKEDDDKVIEDMKESFEKLEAVGNALVAVVRGPGVKLTFNIDRKPVGDDNSYDAICEGSRQDTESISQWLARKQSGNDLRSILETIAAYKDFRTATCMNCKNMLDAKALPATVRRREIRKPADEKVDGKYVWRALHAECL